MINRNRQKTHRFLTALALAVVASACAATFRSALADEKRVKNQRDEKLALILSRQTGDEIRVYLNTRSAYVHGKTVSTNELQQIVRKSRAVRAVVSAEPDVSSNRVVEVKELIRKSGVKNIKSAAPKRVNGKEETGKEAGAKKTRAKEAKAKDTNDKRTKQQQADTVALVLSRQKGDEIRVYVNSRGSYINGRSISSQELPQIIRKMLTNKAITSAESYISSETVDNLKKPIRDGGVKNIKVTSPPSE